MAWWDTLPIRSGRASASGTSTWYDRPGDPISAAARFAAEELDVALIDGMAASSKGINKGNISTWDRLLGGPIAGAMVSIDTQFDWRTQTEFGFGHCIAHLPKGGIWAVDGSGWLIWVIQTIPATEATSLGSSPIWAAIIAGTHDAKYVKFGERIVTKMAASGHPLKRLIIDANHEMNQSNHHQIWVGNRTEYVSAMTRTITKIREGADNITPGAGAILKFMHRPGYRVDVGDTKVGAYNTFIPTGIDVLSLSLHPDASCNSAADCDALFAGTLDADFYGTDELLATATAMGLPICFPEWAPIFQTLGANGGACPVANTFTQKFFNEVIVPNRAKIVCDCAYHQNVRDKTGYLETDPGGVAEWSAMVDTRKSLWVGIQSDATVPTSDSFSYTVEDDWDQRTATVAVTVQGGAVLFVNATDDAANAAPGTAVVIPVLDNDNASASLLPLVVEPGSVSSPSPSGTAVITAAGNQIRYTPASGVSGIEATFNYTAKPSTAATPTSTATVRVQVTSGPPPPSGGDYPTTANTVTLSSPGQLLSVYNTISSSTTILMPPGNYSGSFNFNRNGLIVMRPVGNNWLGPKFQNRVNISGADNVFVGAEFPNSLSDAMKISGHRSRISRCKSTYTGTAGCIVLEITGGTGIRVDRCDISHKNGTGPRDMCLRCSSNPSLPLNPIIERNWIHDLDGTASGAASHNGCEAVQIGEGGGDGPRVVGAAVRFNLIERHLNESETFSIKSSGNTFTNNIIRNSNRVSSRHGRNNTWIGNRLESSDQFVVWQDDHFYNGNVGLITLDKGNSTVANYYANGHTQATNRPAPTTCQVFNHTGTIRLGGGSVGSALPLNNRIHLASHSGTFLNIASSGTITTGTAPSRPTIVSLFAGNTASTNCGVFAP